MKRLIISISMCIIFLQLFSVYSKAEDKNAFENFMEIANDSDNYFPLTCRAVDIHQDLETKTVTFKNFVNPDTEPYMKPDTNTYIIDENTIFMTDEFFPVSQQFQDFVEGKNIYPKIYIRKSDVWEIYGNENRTVHVTAFFGAISEIVGVGESEDYRKTAIERLNSLNIMMGDENGFRPFEPITRAEMAAIVCRLKGINSVDCTETNFTDVPINHWASGYISTAEQMGIINGNGDGNFTPENYITFEQAVKMIVSLLGYSGDAEKEGGYPLGYLNFAEEPLKLTYHIMIYEGTPIMRRDVAVIINDAIDISLKNEDNTLFIEYFQD